MIDGQVTEFVELGQFLSAVLVAGAAREAKLRVLLVDGNALSRRILPPLLSHFGYAVTAVAGAANAFELQRRKARFYTIVIDLHLPGVDGFELEAERRRKIYQSVQKLLTETKIAEGEAAEAEDED